MKENFHNKWITNISLDYYNYLLYNIKKRKICQDQKKFSESYLEDNGIDAEEVKAEQGYGSEVDIYNGDTITFRNKDGSLAEDTEMSKDEFFETYGHQKEEENDKQISFFIAFTISRRL